MKKLMKVFGVLAVVVITGIVVAVVMVDRIAKAAIEAGGTYALGVDVGVERADVQPLAGQFQMDGFRVANPSGFAAPQFMRLGSGAVAVSFSSLREDTVQLPHLTLSGIDLTLQRKEGRTNYGAVLEHLKQFESDAPAKSAEEDGKRFVIKQLDVQNITVNVDLLSVGDKGTIQVNVPNIQLSDVGAAQGGMPMGDLIALVLKIVLTSTIEAGGGLLPADLLQDLSGQLAHLGSIKEYAAVVSGISQGALQAVETARGNLEATLGELNAGVEGVRGDLEKSVEEGKKAVDGAVEEGKKALDDLKGLIPGKKDDE